MLELALKVPQLHRSAFVPPVRDRHRGLVIARFELAAMIDVSTEAVHEIEAVIEHCPQPPGCGANSYHQSARRTNPRHWLDPQAASNWSSVMTGPESWPLAVTSRSTNSMTAMGAA